MPFRSWTSEPRTVPFSAFAKASRAVRNRNASNGVWVLFLSSLSLSCAGSSFPQVVRKSASDSRAGSSATYDRAGSEMRSRAGSSYENAGKPGNVGSRGFLSMLESTKLRNELSRAGSADDIHRIVGNSTLARGFLTGKPCGRSKKSLSRAGSSRCRVAAYSDSRARFLSLVTI